MKKDDSIMRQLHTLQETLRGSQSGQAVRYSDGFSDTNICVNAAASFDPAVVVAPFVAVIREAYLAGPYKLIALDTVQTLLSCNILAGCDNACDTLSEVVDAITRLFNRSTPCIDPLSETACCEC